MKRKPLRRVPPTTRIQETALAPSVDWKEDESFDEIQEIRKGLPIGAFFQLQEKLGVGTAQLADVVGIPVRTLQRRKDEGRLTKDESDRLDRVRKLLGQATCVFDSETSARAWLTRPQIGLAGFVPLELADTGAGIREVENLLGRIDYGVYA
jgi:putative toxin-antitoxin system antitoxin component (TIGR02293 family)